MYPNLFHIGSFAVTSFGLMMFLAFVAGAWIGGKQAERYGMRSELMWDTLAWVAVSGIIGAKLYFLALNWGEVRADPSMIFDRGGLVWYGGLIGGVIAFGVQVRNQKLPVMTMYDAAAPALALAYAIGRIGCFLVGDDYGRYTDGPLGVMFPGGGIPSATAGLLRSMGDSIPASIADTALVPVHPTQLYETGLALVILAILWTLGKRAHRSGQLFAVFLFLYSIERFFIEFVRSKGDRYVWGLSTSQLVSIALFAVAVWLYRQRGKSAPAAPVVAGGPPPPRGTERNAARPQPAVARGKG